MSETEDKVYSYHTFILPFSWKMVGVDSNHEYVEMKRVFDKNSYWEKTDLKNEEEILSKPDISTGDEARLFYREYQYLYPYVRKSVYGYEDDVCANYVFKQSRNNGKYHIYKRTSEGNKHYVLHINAIRIRIVNTGVALFIMECENHGRDGDGENQTDIGAVKNINDYGRRIKLPFIDKNTNICADRLVVEIPGVVNFVDDFETFAKEVCEDGNWEDNAKRISLNYMCEFIKSLLSYKSTYSFWSRPVKKAKEIQVRPILDDRMYVTFAVSDSQGFVNEVIRRGKDKAKNYFVSRSLYEVAYVDGEGNCSCSDEEMREDLIDKALYKRWLPWGSLYTITEMGFGMISSVEIDRSQGYLYEIFLTCYHQMVYIALAQRASIVKFNSETSDIARHFAANGRKLNRSDIRKIMNLQERHAAFNSQLVFCEVSPEQQGIEMYDMLKSVFALEAENEKLDKNLNSLYEITNTDLNISVNTGVAFLTWASIILALGSLLYTIMFTSDVVVKPEFEFGWPTEGAKLFFIAVILGLSVVALIIIKFHNRRK